LRSGHTHHYGEHGYNQVVSHTLLLLSNLLDAEKTRIP